MDKYEGMALKLRGYELKMYGRWKAEAESRLTQLMKRPLLAVITTEGHTQHDVPKTPKRSKNNERFVVNFDPEIREIITEAKYLGLLGYSVPPVALNAALQEYKLIRYYKQKSSWINLQMC